MWIALFVMVGLGAVWLKMAPPKPARRHEVEGAFWKSTTWSERRCLDTLTAQLPGEAASFASLDLRRLVTASRNEFIRPTRVATAAHGPRDLCLVDLPDGSTLRLTVFDDRNAARFVDTWSTDAELALRLRFVEGVGWQCSLHPGVGSGATAVASVYGWLAEIDRSRHFVKG